MAKKLICGAVLLACSMTFQAIAQAQDEVATFPNRPVRFVAPFAAGATTDTLARLVAAQLAKSLGQPVIVENKPGAGGIIGTQALFAARPDGYTVVVGGSAVLVFNRLVYAKLPYNPDDLVPITILADYPLVIAVRNDLPVKTVGDMVRLAKEKPGQLTYSLTSATFQAQMEYLSKRLDIKLMPITYKGGGDALQAVLGKVTDMIAQDPTSLAPMHKNGRLRAIAVTSKQRNPALPDVPTLAESGLADFETGVFMALAIHRQTPPAIVRKLQQEVAKALAIPEVRERIIQFGMMPGGASPEESAARIQRELATYGPIVEAAGMRATQ